MWVTGTLRGRPLKCECFERQHRASLVAGPQRTHCLACKTSTCCRLRGASERDSLKTANAETTGVKEILERTEAELVQVLRNREGIAIEKSADPMDEIQYASERDLAIRSADRESVLLRLVRGALRRIHDGSFGSCMECEMEISPKRLAAVPWAAHCIQCQEAADRDGLQRTDLVSEAQAA